jgi:hypothetical protein
LAIPVLVGWACQDQDAAAVASLVCWLTLAALSHIAIDFIPVTRRNNLNLSADTIGISCRPIHTHTLLSIEYL